MRNTFLLILINTSLVVRSLAQPTATVTIPAYNDTYCTYVKQLEAGELAIDYQDFRFSFLESQQFIVANEQAAALNSLHEVLPDHLTNGRFPEALKAAKQILSIDYTDMLAHFALQQAYLATSNVGEASHYESIYQRLMESIIKGGDGKSCSTGWPVIQISEEYFVLLMMNAKLKRRSTDYLLKCDKMFAKVAGKRVTLEGVRELGGR